MSAVVNTPLPLLGAGSLVGSPVRRIEDPALLTGTGTFIDNLALDRAVHIAFARSPYAHAAIVEVHVSAASQMPGVVAVYTARDIGVAPYAGMVQLHPDVARPALASDEVHFVGDTVAVVVAETKAQAVDAAERVDVEYDMLPAVVDMEAALAPDAPQLFASVESNVVQSACQGSDDPLGGAEVVVRGRFENQRIAVAPMEGAAVAVVPGTAGDAHDLTIYLACQLPHMMRDLIAQRAGVDADRIRLIAPHVGGSFGAKHFSTESLIAVKIAQDLGRPVKWVETRFENMLAQHGRGQVQYVELGLRRDGTIVGLRCRMLGDTGAYAGFGGILVGTQTRSMAQGTYLIPKIQYSHAMVATNTTPMGAYRGAGRPEAAAFLERLMDIAADELGIDPAEIRRQNFISPEAFPFATQMGTVYDSGEYRRALDEALRIAGYDELLAEQAARRERGDRLQLGIGIGCYVEITGAPRASEFAAVEVHADGSATIRAGTSAHGQGHATAFSQLVAGHLGIPIESVRFVQSDTALVPRGGGTGGSRSLQLGGSAVLGASRALLERAKGLAADAFEASVDDIVVGPDGGLAVAGVPSTALSWQEIASTAADQSISLSVEHDQESEGPSFPFGAHVSVVEVDMETGRVTPVRHVAVDDCGRIINPLLVAGQVHGGLASGISQALWEQFVYDADGNPLTSSLAEYAMPSAAELPSYEIAQTVTLSPNNLLGAKGIGESATVGSTPAVQNAVVDALSHLGIRHVDMPCTPERVWRAIQAARAGTPPDPWREPPAILATLDRGASPSDDDEIHL